MIKAKGKIFFIALLVVFMITYIFLSQDFNNYKCKNILELYGWNVIDGGKSSSKSIILNDSFSDDEVFILKRDASKAAGFDPIDYKGKSFDVYSYKLEELGLAENLICEFWLYNNDVICGYIFHTEPNIRMKFWPINMDYAKIRSEIEFIKDN